MNNEDREILKRNNNVLLSLILYWSFQKKIYPLCKLIWKISNISSSVAWLDWRLRMSVRAAPRASTAPRRASPSPPPTAQPATTARAMPLLPPPQTASRATSALWATTTPRGPASLCRAVMEHSPTPRSMKCVCRARREATALTACSLSLVLQGSTFLLVSNSVLGDCCIDLF